MSLTQLLFIVLAFVGLSVLAIVITLRKSKRVKRFLLAHPEAIWVWYRGPKKGVLLFGEVDNSRGIDFNFKSNGRGLLVLPGPVRVQISYYNSSNIKKTSFTQILQFTALSDKEYSLVVDEQNKIMRALTL